MEQAPEKMSDDVLLDQINCFDPYDVEFAKRYRAQVARIAHLEAQVAAADALAEAFEDFNSKIDKARAPVGSARIAVIEALAAYNEAKKGGA